MATRTLDGPPSVLPLYARAAAPLIPGASLLPFVPGGGDTIPELELELPGVLPDADRVAAYARVCGFSLRDHLPPTYPHVLAFPLHMAVMADGEFPFGAVGLVHLSNRIVQHRRIGLDEELHLVVRPTELRPHPRGQTFSLLTEAWTGRQRAWESTSTMLRRGNSSAETGQAAAARDAGQDTPQTADRHAHQETGQIARKLDARAEDEPGRSASASASSATRGPGVARSEVSGLAPSAEWRLAADLGRRYAAVSGDRNPIHMHSLTAKPLGFPSAIAHGMWTKARCLAALESRLPDAFAVEVSFRKPIRLPSRVEFLSAGAGAVGGAGEGDVETGAGDRANRGSSGRTGDTRAKEGGSTAGSRSGAAIVFAVRAAQGGKAPRDDREPKQPTPHLDGSLKPVEAKPNSGRKSK